MKSIQPAMATFKSQLEDGDLIVAYQGLIGFIRNLRSHFEKQHSTFSVPGNIYYGYLDMTYFAVVPPALKLHKLKIAIVFDYKHFRFEVWLSGANRKVQARTWKMWKDNPPGRHRLAADPETVDYIMANILVDDPDFSDLSELANEIEAGALAFIGDVERMLPTQPIS